MPGGARTRSFSPTISDTSASACRTMRPNCWSAWATHHYRIAWAKLHPEKATEEEAKRRAARERRRLQRQQHEAYLEEDQHKRETAQLRGKAAARRRAVSTPTA